MIVTYTLVVTWYCYLWWFHHNSFQVLAESQYQHRAPNTAWSMMGTPWTLLQRVIWSAMKLARACLGLLPNNHCRYRTESWSWTPCAKRSEVIDQDSLAEYLCSSWRSLLQNTWWHIFWWNFWANIREVWIHLPSLLIDMKLGWSSGENHSARCSKWWDRSC